MLADFWDQSFVPNATVFLLNKISSYLSLSCFLQYLGSNPLGNSPFSLVVARLHLSPSMSWSPGHFLAKISSNISPYIMLSGPWVDEPESLDRALMLSLEHISFQTNENYHLPLNKSLSIFQCLRENTVIQYKNLLAMYQVAWRSKKKTRTIYLSTLHLLCLIMSVKVVFCRWISILNLINMLFHVLII